MTEPSDPAAPVAVVVGPDAARVGEIVADLEGRGVRAVAFIGDPGTDADAIVEMLAELFATRGAHNT